MRPIFTGSPSIVQGGFNLDTDNQSFAENDIIPAGSLAIYDEAARTVKIVRTSKVVEVDADDAKIVSLQVGEFFAPCFVVGCAVAKAGAISGTFADAAKITKIDKKNSTYVITLNKAVTGLKVGDTLIEVVADSKGNAAEIGTANSLTIADVTVGEFETPIDVTADTMQYALLERRTTPIPASQKNSTGLYLAGNVHVKLSQSY